MSKKVKQCPECQSTNLGDRWCDGRKLLQYCTSDDCNWKGTPRIPERLKVTGEKKEYLDGFSGHDYILYDRYGHVMTLSRSYARAEEAERDMNRDLLAGENNPNAGPYTGVLFHTPSSVTIKGKIFKVKNGKARQVSSKK